MTDHFDFSDLEDNLNDFSLEDALEALQNENNYTSAAVFYGLSDMSCQDLPRFQAYWNTLQTDTKRHLMQHLIDISEANFELNYRTLGLMALEDNNDEVRKNAVEMLWEDETEELLRQLIKMSQWDPSSEVRAVSVGALGRFILLGEYDKIKPENTAQAQEVAIQLWNNPDEDMAVRCRALEAIANSSSEFVNESITEAYHSNSHPLVVSAIYAMGRSCDPFWSSTVLKELSNENPEIRYEATKASGELELEEAIPALRQLALSDERGIQEVAIWSLGEIGGDDAVKALTFLNDNLAGDTWTDLIDEAIANANLSMNIPDLLDFRDEGI